MQPAHSHSNGASNLQMKFIFLVLVLVIVLAAGVEFVINKREPLTHKEESVKFNLKDLPEHGISLIAPSDRAFTKAKTITIDPYSVLLKNTSSRAVVGYSINWQCFDGKTESANRDMSHDRKFSNSLGFAFMYGEESERRAVLKNADEVIQPNSTWLISPNFPARKMSGAVEEVSIGLDQAALAEVQAACPTMTVTADGIFFDDGTFIGPDANNFFAKVKTQMDARYELLQGVQSDLKSGN